MIHQSGKSKLNVKPAHKRSMMRNQVLSLITYGYVVSTKARVKETRRLAEKLITLAREGNTFNVRRRVKSMLPYKEEAVIKLLQEIAPKYQDRPGGYTRIISMGQRPSDTAHIARLEWV